MDNKIKIGNWGENIALDFLKKKRYNIIKRNFRVKLGEIDIIARDKDGCLVFVEVKTRKNSVFGFPSEYVDAKKQARLRRAAYLFGELDGCMRFDIIEVMYEIKNKNFIVTEINHIENAF